MRSPLAIDTCRERLLSALMRADDVVGSMAGDVATLQSSTTVRKASKRKLVVLTMTLAPTPAGTDVACAFATNAFDDVFMWLWFAGLSLWMACNAAALVVCVALIAVAAFSSVALPVGTLAVAIVFEIGMFAFGIGMKRFGTRFARSEHDHLLAFLRRTLDARMPDTPSGRHET